MKKTGLVKILLLSFSLWMSSFSVMPLSIYAEEKETEQTGEMVTETISEQNNEGGIIEEQAEAPLPDADINATEVASGTSGTVKWVLDSDGLLTISPVSGSSGTFESLYGTINGAPWSSYRESIKSVKFTGTIYGAWNMSNMFYHCSSLTSLDVRNFDTSNTAVMYSMFKECSSLTNLNLSSFDTRNATSMFGMFSGCNNLKTLNIRNFCTDKVVEMSDMFRKHFRFQLV